MQLCQICQNAIIKPGNVHLSDYTKCLIVSDAIKSFYGQLWSPAATYCSPAAVTANNIGFLIVPGHFS